MTGQHSIGQSILANRNRRGLSQSEFARRLTAAGLEGFHQTTVSRIEKDERPVRLDEAPAIASVLGTTVMDLLGMAEIEVRGLVSAHESGFNAGYRDGLNAALRAVESIRDRAVRP